MTEQFAYFDLVFTNHQTRESRPVRFNIEQHSLGQRWAAMLKDLLLAEAHLEKNYLFHGWCKGERNLKFLCAEMNEQIKIVNKYFSSQPPKLYYHISQVFDEATVNQHELNLIHHDFELLMGQVWDLSKFFLAASSEVKHAIRQINNLCHEMEAFLHSQASYSQGYCNAYMIASMFPKTTQNLLAEDRQHFKIFNDFGVVHLHYAQTGKTHLEAFFSNDDIVHDKNITGLRYLSGEFDIFFGDYDDPTYREEFKNKFFQWLQERGVNPAEHNLGFAPIAHLDRSQFPGMKPFEILNELFRYTDVSEIILQSNAGTYALPYAYRWSDPGMAELQVQILSKQRRAAYVGAAKRTARGLKNHVIKFLWEKKQALLGRSTRG